jgi:hypothetical protein
MRGPICQRVLPEPIQAAKDALERQATPPEIISVAEFDQRANPRKS